MLAPPREIWYSRSYKVNVDKIGEKMRKIRILLLSLVAAFSFAMPAVAHAAVIDGGGKLQEGVCATTGTGSTCNDGDAEGSFKATIKKVVDVFSIVVGAIAVIMIIVGGFRYIVSGGDSGNVTSAKNTILYAIVGLVIVAFAQIIVNFVVDQIIN